jgi:exodeoxyribonuclease V beta subunit
MSFKPFLSVGASAGSGKTFSLVVRYLTLLFSGVEPQKIVALTFTNKAASEMYTRVVRTIKYLDRQEERDKLEAIAKALDVSPNEVLGVQSTILTNFLQSTPRIMTIDKFFAQILKRFSLHLGLMPNFVIGDVTKKDLFREHFLHNVEIKRQTKSLIHLQLNFSKRLEDIFSVLEEHLLLSTYTEHKVSKSSQKLHDIEVMIMQEMEQFTKIVQACQSASASALKAVDVGSVEAILQKTWIEKEEVRDYRFFKKCANETMQQQFIKLKSTLILYFQEKERALLEELYALVATYKETKEALGKKYMMLDFNDLARYVYRLIRQMVDKEFIVFRLDASTDHILLDEFQDTSVLQYEILEPMIEEIFSGYGAKSIKSFFYVGDIKQSIYRFRGGNQALFAFLHHHYPLLEQEELRTNYRSAKNVVTFVNNVFTPTITGYVPQLVNSKELGYVQVQTSEEIVDETRQKVNMLLDAGVDENSIAILVVTNKDAVSMQEVLQQEGIAVVTEASTYLQEQQSVHLLITALYYCYFKAPYYRNIIEGYVHDRPLDQLATLSLRQSLLALAKKVVDILALRDNHLVKFLATLDHFHDIHQFIFEHDLSDTTASNDDLHGVRILTVHKSKGLEFDHVIIADRLGKAPPSRSTFIYHYEKIVLKALYLRQKGREFVDSNYHEAMEEERSLVHIDQLNAQYVALTRAKKSLIIVQKEKNSFYSTLTLHDQVIGALDVQQSEKTKEDKIAPHTLKLQNFGRQEHFIVDEEEQRFSKEKLFGTALHYALEMLHHFEMSEVDEAVMAAYNHFAYALDDEAFEALKMRLTSLVNDENFKQLIEGKRFKEQPIFYKDELKYMDMMIEQEDHMIIIDYKSSQKFFSAHQRQVREYMQAVHLLTNKVVKGVIVYVEMDKTTLVEVNL